jgi:hypothetical protein
MRSYQEIEGDMMKELLTALKEDVVKIDEKE